MCVRVREMEGACEGACVECMCVCVCIPTHHSHTESSRGGAHIHTQRREIKKEKEDRKCVHVCISRRGDLRES